MRIDWSYAKLFVALTFIGLGIRGCIMQHKYDNQSFGVGVEAPGFRASDVKLGPNDAEVIALRAHTYADVRHDRTQTGYIPEGASVKVSVSKTNVVAVSVQHKGLCFSPGVGAAFAGRWSVVIDARLGYWDRLSLLGGLNIRPLTPYAGLGYAFFGHTSCFVGYTAKRSWLAGLRVSF